MGFLNKLFGGNKQDAALQQAFEHIKRILEDEEFQIDLIYPAMREMIKHCPAYDKDPNGTGPFGYSEKNPTPVNGPIGQLAHLSRLETSKGGKIAFSSSRCCEHRRCLHGRDLLGKLVVHFPHGSLSPESIPCDTRWLPLHFRGFSVFRVSQILPKLPV